MLWVALLISIVPLAQNQVNMNELSHVQITAEISERMTMEEAFTKILRNTGVSGGIATVESGCALETNDFYLPKGMYLSTALDVLSAKDGHHAWKPGKGIIEVFPKEGIPQLLKTKIIHVHISNRKNLTMAVDELLGTTELQKGLAQLNALVRPPEPGFQKLNTVDEMHSKIPMDLDDISLIEALNSLAAAEGNLVWSYREVNCDGHIVVHLDFISR